jgi:hypothetical protein
LVASRAAAYSYDANGNLTAGGGRTDTWTIDNLPLNVSHVSGSESESYDADGERVKKVTGSDAMPMRSTPIARSATTRSLVTQPPPMSMLQLF